MDPEHISKYTLTMLSLVPFVMFWFLLGVPSATDAEGDQASAVEPNPVVESYARDYGVSFGEALRRLDRVGELKDIVASIRDLEIDRVAGWGIDHDGDFGAWVWLQGSDDPDPAAARIASGHDDVEIRTGNWSDSASEHAERGPRRPRSSGDSDPAPMSDEEPGDVPRQHSDGDSEPVVVSEGNNEDFEVQAAQPVEGIGAPAGSEDTATSDLIDEAQEVGPFRYSGRLYYYMGGEYAGSCTTGFPAKHVGGLYGLITAGHCADKLEVQGMDLSRKNGWKSKTADAQFNTIPLYANFVLSDKYICGPTDRGICDVTGVADRSDMMGDYICHTGAGSGVSCGVVVDTQYALNTEPWASQSACISIKGVTIPCDPVFVKVEGKSLKTCHLDHGGPWYDHHGVAYGIHKGGKSTAGSLNNCSHVGGHAVFSAIKEVEEFLEVKVLTENPTGPGKSVLSGSASKSGTVLSWTLPSGGAFKYYVHRRVAKPGSEYVLAGIRYVTSGLDRAALLTPGVPYEYRMYSSDNLALKSEFSDTIVITAYPVWDLKAEPVGHNVQVSWNKEGKVTHYEIHRRPALAGFNYTKIGTSKTNVFNDPMSGLVPGVEYYYRIKAVGDGMTGVWGGQANYAATRVPAAAGLQAKTTASGISLSWTAPRGDIAGYRIYRRRAVNGQTYSEVARTTTASYSDSGSGLIPGVEYYYRVRAVGSDGELGGWGSGANYANAHWLAAYGLNATLTASDVSLTWTFPTGDVDHFQVYRRVAISGHAYSPIGTTRTANYTDPLSGLTPGVEYYYRVKPVSSSNVVGGWGAGSDYAPIVTLAPSGIEAVVDVDGVTVTWTAPPGDVTGYEVYRRVAGPGQSYSRVTTTVETSYTDPLSDLTPWTSYLYRVRAIGSSSVIGGWGPGPNYAQVTV